MAKGRIDSIIDEQKIKEQISFLATNLDSIAAKIANFPVIQTNSQSAGNLKELSKLQIQYEESLKSVEQLVKQRFASEAKLVTLQTDYAKATATNREEIRKTNRELKLQAQLMQSYTGTIDRARAKIKLLKDERDFNLNLFTDEGRKRAEEINKMIDKYDSFIERFVSKLEQRKLNVGNYAESLAGGFESVRREIARLQRQADEFQIAGDTRGAERARKSLEELGRIQKISYNSNISYTQSIQQLEREFVGMAASGNQSKEFLEQFKEFITESKKEANELKKEIKRLSSDTRNLDLLVGAVRTVTSVFETAAGAAALFGSENENIERNIQKLIAIQTVANGVREVAKEITEKGTIANKAYAAIQGQVAILTDSSAGATKRLNAALKLSGIGLLITGLGFLISKLNLFGDSESEAKKETDKLNESLRAQKKAIDDINSSFDTNIEFLRLRLQREGKTESEIAANVIKYKKQQLEDAKVLEEEALRERAKRERDYQEFIKTIQDLPGSPSLSKKQLEEYQKLYEVVNEKVIVLAKNRENIEIEIRKLSENEQTRVALEGFKKRDELAKKALEAAKKYAEDERKAQLELLVLRQENVQKLQSLIAEDPAELSASIKIEAAKKAAAAERIIIRAQKKYDLEQENLTTTQKVVIRERAALAILDVETRLSQRILQIRINESQRTKEILDQYKQNKDNDLDKRLTDRQAEFDKEKLLAEKFRDDQLTDNQRAFNAGIIEEKKYKKRKEEIETDYQRSVLNSQLQFYSDQLKILKAFGQDVTEAEAAIAAARKALAELDVPKPKSNARLEQLISDLEKAKKAYEEFSEFTIGISNAISQRQLNNIQDQIDAIDIAKAKEIDKINATVEGEEKKAARIKIVEAKAQSDKEALERRKREIQLQQARFEKAATITSIILENSIAIMRALADKNVPYPVRVANAFAVGAIGAGKLAVAIATPLPKFAKGKKRGEDYEGPGIVGEKGREIGIDHKTGSITLYDKPAITYITRETEILPNKVTEGVLASINLAGMSKPSSSSTYEGVTREMFEKQTGILKSIESKSRIIIHNAKDIRSTAYYDYHFKH